MSEKKKSVSNKQYQYALILILIFSFWLRIRTLGQHSLWFDEAIEYWVATAPLDQLFSAVRNSIQDPPLYSVLLHFWMDAGRDEFTLRLPTALVSMLSIAAVFALGRHAHSRTAGLIAAVFFAIIPANVRYAQEVGQYAFLLFGLLISLLAISYARQTNKWMYWIAWLIAALISVHNYYGSLLIVVPVAAAVFVENGLRRGGAYLNRQSIISLSFLILILPLLLFWLPQQLFRGPTAAAFDVVFTSLSTEFFSFLASTFQLLIYQIAGHAAWPYFQLVILPFLVLSLLLALFNLRNSKRHTYILIWLLVCWLTYLLVGRIGLYPYGGSRHALILTPLLVLTISIGIASLYQNYRLFGVTLLLCLSALILFAPEDGREDLRSVVREYLSRRVQSAPTYIDYGAVPAFRYQLHLQMDLVENLPGTWYGDCWDGVPKTYCEQDMIFYGEEMLDLLPEEKAAEIMSTIGSSNRSFWLITSHAVGSEHEDLVNTFLKNHKIDDSIIAEGASAYLFRKH